MEPRRAVVLAVAAITLLGGALRFLALDAESLWYDEAWTLDVVSGGLRHAFERTRRDVHPPLYFLTTHVFVRLAATDWMLRAPSALAGTLTIPLVHVLGTILAGRRVGLVAAALFAVSTFPIYYAQEARMYALLALAATLAATGAAWVLVHPVAAATRLRFGAGRGSVREPNARAALAAWAALALGTAAALLMHHTVLFFAVALGLGVVATVASAPRAARAGLLRNAALAVLVVLLLWGWTLPSVLSQTAEVAASYWVPAPTTASVATSLARAAGGPVGDAAPWRAGLLAAFAVLGLVGLRRHPLRALWLVALVAAAPLGLLAASYVRPIFITRPLIVGVAPLAVLVGAGLLALPARLPRAAAALVLAGAMLAALPGYYASQKKPRWAELGARVAREARAGDAIVVMPGWAARPLRRYHGPWEEGAAESVRIAPGMYQDAARHVAAYARVFAVGAHLWIDPEAASAFERLGEGRPLLERAGYGTKEDEVVLAIYGDRSAEE